MRYLHRIRDFILVHIRVENIEIAGYFDSDFGGCVDDYKFIPRFFFMLIGRVISWKSTKQTLITSFTMYATFVACYKAAIKAM